MVLRFFMNTNERSHQYFKVNTEVIWLELLCNKRKSLQFLDLGILHKLIEIHVNGDPVKAIK